MCVRVYLVVCMCAHVYLMVCMCVHVYLMVCMCVHVCLMVCMCVHVCLMVCMWCISWCVCGASHGVYVCACASHGVYVCACVPAVLMPSEVSTVSIGVGIVDDTLPELDEMFAVRLLSVELLGMPEPGSVPPTLGLNTEVQVTILSSDQPFGTFSLVQSEYAVTEGETLVITIVREGGRLGDITVSYAFNDGRGVAPGDYTEQGTTVVFVEGQERAELVVSIVDDTLPETIEDFSFNLLGVTRGNLGNITMATILIAASDSPFGVVGFSSSSAMGVVINNPVSVPSEVQLIIERREPRDVATSVMWEVTRSEGGVASEDIAASTLAGTLTLASGQV